MKKTKEGMVDGDLFCYLKVVSNFVCLLQGYGRSRSNGVELGGFNVWQLLDGELFFCVWRNFGDGGSSTWRTVGELNEGDVMERIKKGTFQKLDI